MLMDVVIDANVLEHAGNPCASYCSCSLKFVNSMIKCSAALCVDEGFSHEPHKNKSLIGAEYVDRLYPGSVGYAFIMELAQSSRISLVSRKVDSESVRRINRLLSRNKRDRTYVRVAMNSRERVLISHDFKDFSDAVRQALADRFNLAVIDAEEGFIQLEE